MSDAAPWVVEEFRTVEFGDQRLVRRLTLVASRMADSPRESIPCATQAAAETKAAYRLFDNDKVTMEKIIAAHAEETIGRIANQTVALIIQDTTELDFTSKREKNKDAGPMNFRNRRGFLLHSSMAVTPEGLHLGTIHAKLWARDDETWGKKHENRPFEEKESCRWRDGYVEAKKIALACPGTTIVNVGDRDSDIYEYLKEATDNRPENAYFVVRAVHDRCLLELDEEAEGEKFEKLFERLEKTEPLDYVEVQVPKRGKRKARTSTLEVRVATVDARKPYARGKNPELVTLNVVYACEVNPPDGEAEPIVWKLLTNLPIDNFEQAQTVLDYYAKRWQIEVFFRVLKSGCKVEELEFHSMANFAPCLAVYMVVAWRVLNLMMLGRECPDLPCDLLLTEAEWKSAWRISRGTNPPSETPKLGEMLKIIAGFGGHLGRKCDGPPGPKSIWIGLQRVTDFALAWSAFGPE